MLQPGRYPDLTLEPLGAEGGGHLGVQHLDRHRPIVLAVPGEVDRRHPAAAKHALDAVAIGQGGGDAVESITTHEINTPCGQPGRY